MVRTLHRLVLPVLAAAFAAGAAGCDNTTDSQTTTPVSPSTQITESFLGTVGVTGAATFSFNVTAQGNVTATYASIAPGSASVMGLALGIWNGTSCSIVVANDAATVNTTVVGSATAAGALCVRAYDVGTLTATQTVQLSITHY